jgi:hypothetical protein
MVLWGGSSEEIYKQAAGEGRSLNKYQWPLWRQFGSSRILVAYVSINRLLLAVVSLISLSRPSCTSPWVAQSRYVSHLHTLALPKDTHVSTVLSAPDGLIGAHILALSLPTSTSRPSVLGLLFCLEEQSKMFLRNLDKFSSDYTASHPRRK